MKTIQDYKVGDKVAEATITEIVVADGVRQTKFDNGMILMGDFTLFFPEEIEDSGIKFGPDQVVPSETKSEDKPKRKDKDEK